MRAWFPHLGDANNSPCGGTEYVKKKQAPVARRSSPKPTVGLIMGSRSDWETVKHTGEILTSLKIPFEKKIVSAHRTPELLFEYAGGAEARGIQIVIAAAGGAAHLPGMAASLTKLPVIGIPVESAVLRGVDSLLSIVQMPGGIPVGTMAIGKAGARNAALFAAAILALRDPALGERLETFRTEQTNAVLEDKLP